MQKPERYDELARLFEYPVEGDYGAQLLHCINGLEKDYREAADALRPLHEHLGSRTLAQIQEAYTRTFDINPVCSLELGWHIYGEDYARGALLVKLREQLRENGLRESTELPDHLTHVLALLGRLDGESADDLAARYMLPGLQRMLEGVAKSDNPYRALIDVTLAVVRSDHDVVPVAPRKLRTAPPESQNRLPVIATACGGCPSTKKGNQP
jgi:nitrate reductase molybdenum cofactor assembly chaperone